MHAEVLDESLAEPVPPVVEVAGDDERRVGRHVRADARDHRVGLADAAVLEQAEMRADAMDLDAVEVELAMQQSARLEAMVGDVDVLVRDEREARQQRVAVIAVGRAPSCVP